MRTLIGLLALLLPLFEAAAEPAARCSRIVSLAPSVTETLFALGLGERVVGVSRFCEYPPQAAHLPRVGGLLDPNYERILSLNPSVVVSLTEFRERIDELKKLSLSALVLDQRRVADILSSITELGEYCDVSETAAALKVSLESSMKEISTRTRELRKVRTLVVVGSEEVGSLKNLYVSGTDGFYDALVEAAGGVNVISGETKTVMALSLESVLSLRPEVIVEIHPDIRDPVAGRRLALRAWQPFYSVPAVRDGRIYVLGADYAYTPGPRFPLLLRDLASILHPGVFSGPDAP